MLYAAYTQNHDAVMWRGCNTVKYNTATLATSNTSRGVLMQKNKQTVESVHPCWILVHTAVGRVRQNTKWQSEQSDDGVNIH